MLWIADQHEGWRTIKPRAERQARSVMGRRSQFNPPDSASLATSSTDRSFVSLLSRQLDKEALIRRSGSRVSRNPNFGLYSQLPEFQFPGRMR
jgi:hypothetical protein